MSWRWRFPPGCNFLRRHADRRRGAPFRSFDNVMGGVFVLLIAGAVAASIGPVRAEPMASAAACRFESVGTGIVRDVTDGRTVALTDGREVRLDAIEVPHLPAAGETDPGEAAGFAARAAL